MAQRGTARFLFERGKDAMIHNFFAVGGDFARFELQLLRAKVHVLEAALARFRDPRLVACAKDTCEVCDMARVVLTMLDVSAPSELSSKGSRKERPKSAKRRAVTKRASKGTKKK